MDIKGFCAPAFTRVKDAFAQNFAAHGEVGASVAVTHRGETVVDLWGGLADPTTKRPWQEDTLSVVWSSTKGAASLCVHLLAARGQLVLDAPVATYWPEFAQAGKERVTVRMLLTHQAGLAAWREPMPEMGLCDWESSTAALAAQAPYWEPGTRHGYHALTYGHLIGEVVRRATGQTIGRYFRSEIAEPLGLDFWIGLPEEHEGRVAPLLPPLPGSVVESAFGRLARTEPQSLAYQVAMHCGGLVYPGVINQRATHAAEIPAAGGLTNARALAGMYRPLALGGSFGGVELVPEEMVAAMGATASAGWDFTLMLPTRFALGFCKAIDNIGRTEGSRDSILLSEEAFGHAGNGGSLGFADPRAQLSFGYTMNQQDSGVGLSLRCQELVDATYTCLGYRRAARGGIWYA